MDTDVSMKALTQYCTGCGAPVKKSGSHHCSYCGVLLNPSKTLDVSEMSFYEFVESQPKWFEVGCEFEIQWFDTLSKKYVQLGGKGKTFKDE